jgi:hypothetical protein
MLYENRNCPICGSLIMVAVQCQKNKAKICMKHCENCAFDKNYHCLYLNKHINKAMEGANPYQKIKEICQ